MPRPLNIQQSEIGSFRKNRSLAFEVMRGSTYIFIDGAYLIRQHEETLRPWFGFEPNINFQSAIRKFELLSGTNEMWISGGGQPSTVNDKTSTFYYDCLDEE